MRGFNIAILIPLLTFADVTFASLTPVSQFSGQYSETWESFPVTRPSETFLPDPSLIMSGAALVSHPSMSTSELGNTQSLGTSGYSIPSDGDQLMGINDPSLTPVILTFADPIERFGAFWGAATSMSLGDPALIEVRFFDETDFLIGTDVVSYSRPGDGILEWHGWFSGIPIKKITYRDDHVVIDGLQANPVPEPTTAALASLAGALILMRPRRRRL